MAIKWDTVVTITLVVCAVTTTGLFVHREFFAAPGSAGQSAALKPIYLQDWKSFAAKGRTLGAAPLDAPIQIIEFSDFECPFCANFDKTLRMVRERYPRQMMISYVHFPLPMHRFALPAARAAECAGEQDRFEAMHDVIFQQQNELGLTPWSEFAAKAGVPGTGAFEACIQRKEPVPQVVEGRKLGETIDVQATPTLVINGWKLGHPPTEEELDAMVKKILAGKSPVDGKS